VKNGIKVLKTDGQWQRFRLIYNRFSEDSFGRMVIDKNSTKWMATNRDGVIGFNESNLFKKSQ
jgi:hypothetical protein